MDQQSLGVSKRFESNKTDLKTLSQSESQELLKIHLKKQNQRLYKKSGDITKTIP